MTDAESTDETIADLSDTPSPTSVPRTEIADQELTLNDTDRRTYGYGSIDEGMESLARGDYAVFLTYRRETGQKQDVQYGYVVEYPAEWAVHLSPNGSDALSRRPPDGPDWWVDTAGGGIRTNCGVGTTDQTWFGIQKITVWPAAALTRGTDV